MGINYTFISSKLNVKKRLGSLFPFKMRCYFKNKPQNMQLDILIFTTLDNTKPNQIELFKMGNATFILVLHFAMAPYED